MNTPEYDTPAGRYTVWCYDRYDHAEWQVEIFSTLREAETDAAARAVEALARATPGFNDVYRVHDDTGRCVVVRDGHKRLPGSG
ncbi:MAG: hypothetical protein QF464_19785 [Myxococcota bacterium]|nr:hypothetical protein [Myxococcota bacterium]